jgi:hypothetical protein
MIFILVQSNYSKAWTMGCQGTLLHLRKHKIKDMTQYVWLQDSA